MQRHQQESKNHHWWPIGLQMYWSDRDSNINSISPTGEIKSRRQGKNKKMGAKRQGHRMHIGGAWETNFEPIFESVDNDVHTIIENFRMNYLPIGTRLIDLKVYLKIAMDRNRDLTNLARYHSVPRSDFIDLLKLCCSLLIRCPNYRSKMASFPLQFGLPASENVAKMNMKQAYSAALSMIEHQRSNGFFVLLHSNGNEFVFGDGALDSVSDGITMNRIDGHFLIALTPSLAIYFTTPRFRRSGYNIATFPAPNWLVKEVNKATGLYSKNEIFYRYDKPAIENPFFTKSDHMMYEYHKSYVTDVLDEIVTAHML